MFQQKIATFKSATKALFLVAVLMAPLGVKGQDKVHSPKASVEIDFSSGQSSNATLVKEGPAGAYGLFRAETLVTYPHFLGFSSIFWGNWSVQKYFDQDIAELADRFSLQNALGFNFSLGQALDLTLFGSSSSVEGRQVDFESTSGEGLDLTYDERGGGAFFVFEPDFLSYELGFEQLDRDFETFSNDENGNEFLDDSVTKSVFFSIEHNLSDGASREDENEVIVYELSYSDQRYQNRNARFTEGTLVSSLGQNPEAHFSILSFQVGWEKESASGDLEFGLLFSNQKDRVFGAEDFQSYGVTISWSQIIFQSLLMELEGAYSLADYERFVAEVLSDPMADEKRLDQSWSGRARVGLEGWYEGLLPYLEISSNGVASNYDIVDFADQRIQIGFELGFN
jgi:hypothetical protein